MSNFFLADRVKELSRVEGTNTITLDGAANGFSSFADFYASGDTVYYAITDSVKYEIGSGVYQLDGSDRSLTRNPFRSSNITSGPYHLYGSSNTGSTAGTSGYFYPLWITKSAALSGVGFSDGPYTSVSERRFDEYPGITFYAPLEHEGYSPSSHAGVSGSSYATASQPVSFGVGLKEVFVTYPGKTSVYNGYGVEAGMNEPKTGGVAFWENEQIINYDQNLFWDNDNKFLGINKSSPSYALDIGGERADSILSVSGIIEGGSGVLFSGGALTYTGATASGGKQLEPFLRNELGNASEGVIELSGLVSQYIGLAKQQPGTVFAGPASGDCVSPPCDPDYPTFRPLTINDLPSLRVPHATQKTGTYPNVVLKNDSGSTINTGEGIICTYDLNSIGEGSGLAVALPDSGNYVWYKLPITSTL